MMLRAFLVLVLAGTVTTAWSQTAAPAQSAGNEASAVDGGTPTYLKAETAEERMARLGTAEDPGPDPDPNKVWIRFGKTYVIEKYDRRWAAYDQPDPKMIRPFGFANVPRELYQQNEKWVWVWQEKKTAEQAAKEDAAKLAIEQEQVASTMPEQIAYLESMRSEFQTLLPANVDKTVRFEEASTGLPVVGSWRNSAAVADMNKDGHLDIISPPERVGGAERPIIFLGDGKGNWKTWEGVNWAYGIQYGDVAAADFNKDGHMDLAFASHLQGVRVMLGDSKGNFSHGSEGGMLDDRYPTRRLAVADVDLDGYPDILAISEGPIVKELKGKQYGKVRAYMNRGGKRWDGVDASNPKNIFGGDWLAVGKFNADRYPDFVGASIFFHGSEIIHLSNGKAKWQAVDTTKGDLVPFMSYYMAVGAGRFSSKKLDDAIISFVRFWPNEVAAKGQIPAPELQSVAGLDRISFDGPKPRRIPIARWGAARGITGMDAGDFDGDGNLDLLASAAEPREFMLLLGDGKGGFRRASIDGMAAMKNTNYDVLITDVNRDQRPDVVVMYESAATSSLAQHDGSIRVFLNRGVATAAVAEKQSN